jgi:Na+-transporting methylmalonyl-CoA/oxaloacetate decarboxylase gamma subunit
MNTELLPAALLITALGMGLVFVAILLLWGLMELIVRLLPDRAEPEPEPVPVPSSDIADREAERERRRRAAVAAVSAAFALEQTSVPVPSAPDSSRWQDASRTEALHRMAGYYRPRPAAQLSAQKD